jgi:hypothetical protein
MQMTLKIIEKQKYSRLRDRERKNGGRTGDGRIPADSCGGKF